MATCQLAEAFGPTPGTEIPQWYAVHIRGRHEKKVFSELSRKGITAFLPLVTEVHKWTDRKIKVEVPLFSCYAFVNLDWSPANRISVLRIPGVLSFVGGNLQGTPIPHNEIESIQTLINKKVPL